MSEINYSEVLSRLSIAEDAIRTIQKTVHENTSLDELYEEDVDVIRAICEKVVGPYCESE